MSDFDQTPSGIPVQAGRVGVAIDTLRDAEILFDAIPLDQISTSFTINGTAAILLAPDSHRPCRLRHRPQTPPVTYAIDPIGHVAGVGDRSPILSATPSTRMVGGPTATSTPARTTRITRTPVPDPRTRH